MLASSSSSAPRRLLRLASLALVSIVGLPLGCNGNTIELETDDGTGGTVGTGGTTPPATITSTGDDSTGPDPDSSGDPPPEPTQRAVDILFVVDNSGSMGEEQGKLATGIESLIAVLDAANPPVDYRIAVTTTDNGNPWCIGTGPEAGNLRATSCRSRPAEFVFNGASPVDAFDEACGSLCALETLGLDEPWVDVERSTGTTNVPGDAVLDTLRCMLPQGIDGCGFESQLESMRKALIRSETPSDMAYGFLRPGALPAVMLITDEADCSYDAEHESIFLPEGNRVFWSHPDAAAPTSAVCWNAGVACDGPSCFSVNLDVNGNTVAEADADGGAVLRPVSRYVDALAERGAYVAAIYGVNADGTVTYQESLTDPQFQSDFGIGPGCESAGGRAVPPVRTREMIGAVSGPGNEHSICGAGFQVAMTSFGTAIVGRLP